MPNTLTLNFAGGADDIPTFSFADLNACAEKGDKDFFQRHFDGKVVLFGTVLDVEDRKITSKRFATAPEVPAAVRCALPAPSVGRIFTREAIAGVYVHATAVDNLLRGDALTEIGRGGTAAISFTFAALTAVAALALSPIAAALAYLGIAAGVDRGRDGGIPGCAGASVGPASFGRARRARRHDRLPLCRCRPEQTAAAPELRLLSCARRDRKDDGIE